MPNKSTRNPFPPAAMPGYQQPPAGFRCRWIWHPEATRGRPAVMVFRLPFTISAACTIPINVSADQRYELLLDGERLGRGPTRGDLGHWCYETYRLAVGPPGEHLLAARVWWLPDDGAPMAQMYGDPGFVLLAEGPLTNEISTGSAPWEVAEVEAYSGRADSTSWFFVAGWSFTLDGHRYPWGWERDARAAGEWHRAVDVAVPVGQGFHPAADPETYSRRPQHHLEPSPLPGMIECRRAVGSVRFTVGEAADGGLGPAFDLGARAIEATASDSGLAASWQELIAQGTPVTVGPHRRQRVLIDLDNYYCAYPELHTSGGEGATVRLGWSESLYGSVNLSDVRKGDRSSVEGKYVRCAYDIFELEGGTGREYSTLWWRAGRYVASDRRNRGSATDRG